MNPSSAAKELNMHAAFKQRHHELAAKRTSMMKEKEEELALFLEMKRRDNERTDLFLNSYEEFDAPLETIPGTSLMYNISSSTPGPATVRKNGADDFLNADNDKNDYDWLLTPPGTPLFPSLEIDSQKTDKGQLDINKSRSHALKSRLANSHSEPAVKNNLSRQPATSPVMNSSTAATRRPSSSGGPGSRPATPTGRPTLTTVSKPSRSSTPTSRAILPPTKPTVPTTRSMNSYNKPTVSVNRAAVSSAKITVAANNATVSASKTAATSRSASPLSRASARSLAETSRPALPPSKSTSRASTPTRRPSMPLSAPTVSAPPVKSSYSISKTASMMSRNPVASNLAASRNPAASNPLTSRNLVPSRGASPKVRSRPWKPSDMPGFSLDTPPNLRTSLPDRPLSATRGRPGAPTARSSSVEPASSGRPRRQSCSPSRGRAANGMGHPSGGSMPAVNRGLSKINDNISPVVIGTKMVERVINMRKLAPPKQDDKLSLHGNLSGKSSSPDSSHFGSSLSKKSLDMAIRHMDIRRTIPGNLRPLMTTIPASSMYSVRSGSQRSRTVSVSDSPLATSSNASSELSVNNNSFYVDGSEIEDDNGCERGSHTPASIPGR